MNIEQQRAIAIAKARLRSKGESTAPPVENTDPFTLENIAGSAYEPIKAIGTGMVGSILGGLHGAGTLLTGGSSDEATKNTRETADYWTSKPKTSGGKIALEAISAPFEKWAEGTDTLGDMQMELTEGSPEKKAGWATATKTLGDIIPMLLMRKAANGKPLTIKGKRPLKPIEDIIKAPVKIGGKVVKSITNAGKNIFPIHAERAGRLFDELAGSDRSAIVKALEEAKPGETAGQAASSVGRAEFSAVERLMQKIDPTKYSEIGRIRESQQASRIAELKKEGKTPESVAEAMLERSKKATPLYEAGRSGEAVGVDGIISNINKLIKDNPGNLELLTELSKVKKGLTENGVARTSGQEVLSTVDGLKAAISNKDNAFIKGKLTKIKNEIIESAPKYKEGEAVFREMSQPVNQMQVFQQLVKELTPKLGSKDRAVQFVNAMENGRLTIKKSSDGSARFESLDDVLTPKQMSLINKLRAELDRDVSLKQQGVAGQDKLKKTMGDVLDPVEAPGMISSTMMVFRNIMSRLKGHATEGTLNKLAEVWDKPAEVAKLMEKFSPEGKKILHSYIGNQIPAIAAGSEESK